MEPFNLNEIKQEISKVANFSDEKDNYVCPECENTGIVKEKKGVCHTCWKCLQEGRLDCHSKRLPENNIKL